MFKFLWKKFRNEIIVALLILLGILLLLEHLNRYGLGLLAVAALVYALLSWKKGGSPDEIRRLKKELENQRREIEDLRNRKLNVTGIRKILEVGLVEVDTHFTRTWNEKYEFEGKNLHFIGALQVRLKAKYGVNLKDLKIKINHNEKEIVISGLQPKFLSFSDINHEWKIAEMMEYKKRPWIIADYWKKSDRFRHLLQEKLEEKRYGVYEEIKQGPEEMKWLLDSLYLQMENTLRLMLNRPDYTVRFVKEADKDFIPIERYFEKLSS